MNVDRYFLVGLIGLVASLISFVLWLPQARMTWRNRNIPSALAGVSAATMWLVVVNALLWFAYAALTGALWAGAPGLVNLPLALLTLTILHRGSRLTVRTERRT